MSHPLADLPLLSRAALVASGLFASALFAAAPAAASQRFDIPAQPLARALERFAAETGLSVGGTGIDLARRWSAPLRGHYEPPAALRAMLAGTGLVAVAVDTHSFRLTARSADAGAPATSLAGDIEVLATKRPTPLEALPYALSVVTGDQLATAGATTATDAAALVPGLLSTNLGPGRNKLLIRGVSDSPFNGTTPSTVGLYLDDIPITYNAPDPGLRLVDVSRLEILRGPQGTLYGSSAIGGIVRIVAAPPVLGGWDAGAAAGIRATGNDSGYTLDAMLNAPLHRDRLAVRLVGYADRAPGTIDNVRTGARDTNRTDIRGGRVALAWAMTGDWRLTAGAAVQGIDARDAQYGLTALGGARKDSAFNEPHDNDFAALHLTLDGRLGDARLTSATGYVRHSLDSRFDASAAVPAFGGPAGATGRFEEERFAHLLMHETRVSAPAGARIDWLAGISAALGDTSIDSRLDLPDSGNRLYDQHRNDDSGELAAFGEVSLPLGGAFTVTTGLRLHWSSLTVAMKRDDGPPIEGKAHNLGMVPKLVLRYRPDDRYTAYAQVTAGYRPGGINTNQLVADADDLDAGRFRSDHLWNFEAGLRYRSRDARLAIDAAMFLLHWTHMQADQIDAVGLTYTASMGRAQIPGIEAEIAWLPAPGLTLRAHGSLYDADTGQEADSGGHLPLVPAGAAGASARYALPVGRDSRLDAGLDYSYVGRSRLRYGPAGEASMGDYHQLDVSAGYARGPWRLALSLDNLLDSRRNSFAYGNPFSLATRPQVTPLTPRRVGLTLHWRLRP